MILVVFVSSALNISKRQNIVKSFQEYSKTDKFNSFWIIISILHLIGVGITLIKACQIVITNLKYNFYPKAQTEQQISCISQLNIIIAHFLVCYNVDVEKKIKEQYNIEKFFFLNQGDLGRLYPPIP